MGLARGILFVLAVVLVVPELYFRFFHSCDWSDYEGDYALITGSSYGIGRAFAEEFAKRGINVILSSTFFTLAN